MPRVYGFSDFGGPERQEFWEQPRPVPGPGELLIAVKAAGVNPVDVKIRSGALQEYMPVDPPVVMGREASGVVEEVGKDVTGFTIGDEVLGSTAPGSGGFAEYAVLTADTVTKKPAQVSFVDAAALPVAGATALDAVRQVDLSEGQSLLILGIGGGVGVMAAQIARDLNLNVIGTGSAGKRDLAESLGATFLDYTQGDIAAQVRALLPGGVDAIIDLVGGEAVREAAGLVSDRSKVISAGDQTVTEFGGQLVERDRSGENLATVARMVAERKLNPHAVDILAFDKVADAVSGVESGHSRGKVVVQVA